MHHSRIGSVRVTPRRRDEVVALPPYGLDRLGGPGAAGRLRRPESVAGGLGV
ncbi:hypothetical protein GCM10025734_76470 [Kitasatospora paranensis]